MSRSGIAAVVLTTLSAGLLIAAEDSGQTDERSWDEAVLTLPTPAVLAIWTDKPGHLRWHNVISVYLAVNPMWVRRESHEFIYIENIETAQRQHLVRDRNSPGRRGNGRRGVHRSIR